MCVCVCVCLCCGRVRRRAVGRVWMRECVHVSGIDTAMAKLRVKRRYGVYRCHLVGRLEMVTVGEAVCLSGEGLLLVFVGVDR